MGERNMRKMHDYIVTRRQARYIAKRKMKEEGKTKICKSYRYSTISPLTKKPLQHVDPSFFSQHWREYQEVM